ncbi:hypothetical protein RclHR1_00320022 [Rhizophagus clarus]|uniref:Uncharacterized protein n=1 Tax=Rhizophagus clarus TaxID=94130 RepID=A0A2Z6R7N0_9GLOM|nr:hypothetical protein RclHR1_00320022 [Rhizophagus clarus]
MYLSFAPKDFGKCDFFCLITKVHFKNELFVPFKTRNDWFISSMINLKKTSILEKKKKISYFLKIAR